MPFPRKFQPLIETTFDRVSLPDNVWISYAVCVVESQSCGWAGWILEGVAREAQQLPADTLQRCPHCGKPLFRTEVAVRLEPSGDQRPPRIAGRDYDVVPIEYTDDL